MLAATVLLFVAMPLVLRSWVSFGLMLLYPAVTVASASCRGSYEQLNTVMETGANQVAENGYELDGPAFNIYHVSPHETADPNEFVTQVCYPVKKK